MHEAGVLRIVGEGLLALQVGALLLVLTRLMPGRVRRPPVRARSTPRVDTTVTVVVATLNEAARIEPCLAGLLAQVEPMLEVLVVDSRSTDGTRDIVLEAAQRDPRIRLLTDDPRPDGWVGAYSPDSRKVRISRFMEKRNHRTWTKTVKYDVRKNFADSRLRVKGRFVKKEDESLMRELMSLT